MDGDRQMNMNSDPLFDPKALSDDKNNNGASFKFGHRRTMSIGGQPPITF